MPNHEVVIEETREDSEMHRVLELALEAGRVLLSNGAEIFRVEETIGHICKSKACSACSNEPGNCHRGQQPVTRDCGGAGMCGRGVCTAP